MKRRSLFLFLLPAMFAGAAFAAAPAIQPTVGEGFVNPTGFHDATPSFSWKLPSGVIRQTAYRIQTSTTGGRSWDSGWVESDQSTFVPYGGAPLDSRDCVTWKVNYRDEKGAESGWGGTAHFELGLLSAKDWAAKWIRPSQEIGATSEPVGMLRRAFRITRPVAKARLYATALGVYEIRINNQRVGDEHFANGFTSYKNRIDTFTHDVTKQLRAGDNTLDGLLGTGWYAGRFPFETKNVGPYGRDFALLAQLEIFYADGTTEVVVSDEKWEGTFDGPIISSSLYDGENYDARRQPQVSDWAPVLADANLGDAALTPKPFAPVRETQALAVQRITQPQPGRYVFDLGQNMVGWARLKIPAEKDKTVTVRFAEMLQDDGTPYTANYRTAKSTDTYTAAQTGIVEWEPHFTFHGFRYVELSGLPEGVKPEKSWVTGVVLRSDIPTTGRFQSSHAKLNQLQGNIVRGWRGNSLDVPTDCPQRDERMGWTGDAQVFCATSMFNTDAHAFWKSWLGSMRDDQYSDGAIPPYIPTAMSKWEMRSPGWMDAGAFVPWDVYVRTGDVEMLSENYAMMERLAGWYRSQSKDGLIPKIKGFGDWLQPYAKAQSTPGDRDADRKGDTPLPLLGTAFHARCVQILADSARALGRNADAQRHDKEAATVRDAFTREYFDANGKLQNTPETQTAYVLAIAFNLIPPELKAKAGAHLARLVREADGHLRTGFLGTPHLASALDRTGHPDVAAEILFKETYPSWFYPINQGATTMWERWNSYTRDKGFGDVAMNSFNHYAYGAIGQWMYERIAGLAPDPASPGYKHFLVRPLIVAQLDSAGAELETPYGKAASAWTKSTDGSKVAMNITVPPNTTATIEFPDGRAPQTVTAGSHHFEIKRTTISHEEIRVEAPFAMPAIRVPIFPARDFVITDFGAKPNDQAANTDAIRKAIAACHAAGGGRVVVPAGEWITGAIHLKTNVNLHLAKDAVLSFSDDPRDYLPAVQSSWEGWECFNYSPLIYAFQCENVALTGEGKIEPRMGTWKKWSSRPPAHMDALKRLYTMGSTGVPVEKRRMAGGENNMRPQLIQFNRCKNALIEDITIRNSPFWVVHLLLCDSVVVRRINVSAHGHNNDGIDPENTRNLLVEDCTFDQGDDAIVIKSGSNQDGWRLDTPSENIVIRNCVVKNGHQIVAIGSELSGGVRNVHAHDIRFEAGAKDGHATTPFNILYIKTNRRRGGVVENITVENIDASAAKFRMGVFGIETDILYQWRKLVPTYEERITTIRNITVRNIKAGQTATPFLIMGDKDQPVRNVTIDNIAIGTVRGQKSLYRHAENVIEKNISMGTFIDEPYKESTNK